MPLAPRARSEPLRWYDTGFTMNLLRGSLTALVTVACAWPAARFFGDPRLTTIFLVLALALFSTALENIGTIDFQRDMVFSKQIRDPVRAARGQRCRLDRVRGDLAELLGAGGGHPCRPLVATDLHLRDAPVSASPDAACVAQAGWSFPSGPGRRR